MRVLRWGLGTAVAAAALYLYFAALHPRQRSPDHAYFDRPGPWVIAHRGGSGLWPENTLLALERAAALGVDALEMDLRMTADGVIVLMHDETVDRTTNGSGQVRRMRFAQLRTMDAGHRFLDSSGRFSYRGKGLTVPSLEEALSRFVDIRLNVEMKDRTPELAARLCGLLRQKWATGRVLVASFDQRTMEAFREACPSVATSATPREALTFYQLGRLGLLSLYRSPAAALQIPEFLRGRWVVDAKLLASAAALNVNVEIWTVNRPADMKRLLDLGVHGILTDYPDRLLRLMGRLPAHYDSSDEATDISDWDRSGAGAGCAGAERLDGLSGRVCGARHLARDRDGETGRVWQGLPHGIS